LVEKLHLERFGESRWSRCLKAKNADPEGQLSDRGLTEARLCGRFVGRELAGAVVQDVAEERGAPEDRVMEVAEALLAPGVDRLRI